MFKRAQLRAGAGDMPANARVGDGWLANPSLTSQAADSNQTITATAITGGVYLRSGLTVGRSDTLDTAVNILAASDSMDIGDNFVYAISNQSAQILTLTTAAGVTLAGKTTVPASGYSIFVVTKTGLTTVTHTGL